MATINQDDDLIIPHNKILCISRHPHWEATAHWMVEPLREHPARTATLGAHHLHCLPVVIGSQYGFAVRSLVGWSADWNGGPALEDTVITIDDPADVDGVQLVSSHFGNGIVTIQNQFSFRTAPGINLMVLNAPNYFHFNLDNLFAVVETDNLRRDFTFNLKIVKPGVKVSIKKGDVLSAIIPIPRYFVDDFSIALGSDYFDQDALAQESRQFERFSDLRTGEDVTKPHQVGKLYWRGLDADGKPFADHQRKLRPAGWTNWEDYSDNEEG